MKNTSAGERPEYVFALTSAGVLTVTHSATPADATFDSFLDFCDAHRRDLRCYLILAGAGAPTAAQRARSSRRHPHLTPIKTAILAMDQGMLVPVAGLLQRERPTQVIQTFPGDALPDALSFLGLPDAASREACQLLVSQARAVNLTLPQALLYQLRNT